MPLNALSRRALLPATVLTAGLLVATAATAEMRPIQIQNARVVQPGQMELFGNLAYELSREPAGADYDNLRVGPLGMRFGLENAVEVGGHLTFNSNSGDSSGDPDESGLEALTGFAKVAIFPGISAEGGIRVAGADDVGPYPMDGIDFYVNLAAEQEVGAQGKVYGEIGLTIQDNDGFGGTYEHWGLGYAHRINPRFSLNAELVGDAAPGVGFIGVSEIDGDEVRIGGGNHMDLVLGANYNVQQAMLLRPYVSVGVYDASPDVAVGIGVDFPL